METTYKRIGLPCLRVIELLCIATTITGFLWASSDLLLTSILVGAPVTPLSVLFMLYGFFGTGTIEVVIRLFNRKSKPFLQEDKPRRETNG
jgi:hypothetical protein